MYSVLIKPSNKVSKYEKGIGKRAKDPSPRGGTYMYFEPKLFYGSESDWVIDPGPFLSPGDLKQFSKLIFYKTL